MAPEPKCEKIQFFHGSIEPCGKRKLTENFRGFHFWSQINHKMSTYISTGTFCNITGSNCREVSSAVYDHLVVSCNLAVRLMNESQSRVTDEDIDALDVRSKIKLLIRLHFTNCFYFKTKGIIRPEGATQTLIEPEWDVYENKLPCGR